MDACYGLYIPVGIYVADNGYCCAGKIKFTSWFQISIVTILIILSEVPTEKVEKKPKEVKKCVDKCVCEANLGQMFTKKRKNNKNPEEDGKNCVLSEYMDSISRNGANFLEKQNIKEDERMAKCSGNKNCP